MYPFRYITGNTTPYQKELRSYLIILQSTVYISSVPMQKLICLLSPKFVSAHDVERSTVPVNWYFPVARCGYFPDCAGLVSLCLAVCPSGRRGALGGVRYQFSSTLQSWLSVFCTVHCLPAQSRSAAQHTCVPFLSLNLVKSQL